MMKKIYGCLQWVCKKMFGNYERVVDFTRVISDKDKKEAKIAGALGYICFIIPMILCEDKQFARFHCNQSLVNLLLSTVVALLWSFIPYVGVYMVLLQELLCLFFALRGIIQCIMGTARSIPFVGWITIVAYRYPHQA